MYVEKMQFVNAMVPLADRFAGGSASDVISMAECSHLIFIVPRGVCGAATPTFTVQSCDQVSAGLTATAIVFKYAQVSSANAQAALAAATTSGYTSTTGANRMDIIEVDAKDLSGSDKYCRLYITETVDSAVTGCVIGVGIGKRYSEDGSTILT